MKQASPGEKSRAEKVNRLKGLAHSKALHRWIIAPGQSRDILRNRREDI